MRTRQLQYLRPDEILAEREEHPVVYLPLGLLEWHGPHLPLGVDALNAEAVALKAAEQAGGLVMPPLYCGTERERDPELLDGLGFGGDVYIVGMDFPANPLPSMYVPEEIFALMVRENIHLLQKMEFEIIVLVSGHAAVNQLETLERLAAEFNGRGESQVLVALPFVPDESGTLAVGHASRVETAVMLALAPETVRTEALPRLPAPLPNWEHAIVDYFTFNGRPTRERTVRAEDDPRRATAALGHENINRAAAAIAERVREAEARRQQTGG